MPIYKKKGREGRYRVVIWHQGRPNEWVIQGTKKDAEAFEARERLKFEANTATKRTAPTFFVFSTGAYSAHAATALRASTWSVRKYHIATLGEFFGKKKLTEISPEDVEEYKQERLKEAKPISVRNELKAFQAILSYARDMRVPMAQLKIAMPPVRGRGRVTFWTEKQVTALYESVQSEVPELMAMVVFLANTGCRKGEGLAADWGWVDLKRGLIRIPVTEHWRPKSDEPREVPISSALRPWLAMAGKKTGPMFPSREGTRYAYFPNREFRAARNAAGLKGGPHTLRHTFAAHFLSKCPDMYLLAQVMGHSHSKVTELYAHLLPDHLARARDVVSFPAPAETMAKTMAG